MTTTTTHRGGRPPVGKTTKEDSKTSAQGRWIPGPGQALQLNQAAATMGTLNGRKATRAALLREITAWGLTRTLKDIRAQEPVPATPWTAPLAEKSVSWVPGPKDLEKLDAQAARVGELRDGTAGRNAMLRLHVAAWLEAHPTP